MKLVAVNEQGCRIGESHPRARLSDATIDLIRELHEDKGKSYGYIAMKLSSTMNMKISKVFVQMICTYRRRAQIPDRWVRVE